MVLNVVATGGCGVGVIYWGGGVYVLLGAVTDEGPAEDDDDDDDIPKISSIRFEGAGAAADIFAAADDEGAVRMSSAFVVPAFGSAKISSMRFFLAGGCCDCCDCGWDTEDEDDALLLEGAREMPARPELGDVALA